MTTPSRPPVSSPSAIPFLYEGTPDIEPGMTLAEYRRRRAAQPPAGRPAQGRRRALEHSAALGLVLAVATATAATST
jgi:hypothetical protein